MKTITALATAGCIAALSSGAAAAIWLNELHYDNAGSDVGEGIEIAADFEMDSSLLEIQLYNGSNGSVYRTWDSDDFTGNNAVVGGSVIWVLGASNSIQNGSPDGVAIIYDGELVGFYSYEGTMVGSGGFADGVESTDIGISEASSTEAGTSLQLAGTGSSYGDFAWGSGDTSWGALNAGQTIGAVPAPGALALLGLAGLAGGRRRRH